MNHRSTLRTLLLTLLAVLVPLAGILPATAQSALEDTPSFLDYGFQGEGSARIGGLDAREGQVAPTAAQEAIVADLGATRVQWNPFGTPDLLINHGGYLSGPREGEAVEVARAFIADHAELFRLSPAGVDNLTVLRDSPLYDSPDVGRVYREGLAPENPDIPHVVLFQQTFDDLEAGWDGRIKVGVARDGRVAWVHSSATGDDTVEGRQELGPEEALLAAAADVDLDLGALEALPAHSDGRWLTFTSDLVNDVQRARLVAVPTPTDGVRLAWKVFLLDSAIDEHGNPTAFLSVVDAETGEVLIRSNRVEHAASGLALGSSITGPALAQVTTPPTAVPFSGEVSGPDPGQCDPQDHVFPVGAGNSEIQVLVNSTDFESAFLDSLKVLLYLDGSAGSPSDGAPQEAELVAQADPSLVAVTGPTNLTYTPDGGVQAGTYIVKVCNAEFSFQAAAYQGLFLASQEPVNLANPQWRVFPANPRFPDSDDPSVDTRVLWCWMGEGPNCDEEQFNLASRVPWDFRVESDSPTFTTDGNNASTAISEASFLTPDTAADRPALDPQRDYQATWNNTWFENNCDPATFVEPTNGNDDDASMYNLFVMHNRMHDWSYYLGMTEVNGALQQSSFGNTGPERENDPELGSAQAGRLTFNGRDNANQITPPDGIPGITNQYLWQPLAGAFYAACTDGAYDMAVVAHEYGHAISNRMSDPFILSGTGSTQGQSESWSDLIFAEYFRGFGISAGAGANPFALAPYVSGDKIHGIRNYSMSDSPLNYSDVDYDGNGRGSPHADGEIWSAVNYAIGEAFNDRYDAEFPSDDAALQEDCALGVLPARECPGNRRWAQLMFDGFLLQGSNTTQVDSRDAMLAADLLRFDGANQDLLWDVFARHGLGETASSDSPQDLEPIPGWSSPVADDEATIRFEAAEAGGDTPENMEVFAGVYEARITPAADTNPDTPFADTIEMVPGTYEFVARADGFGAYRFEVTVEAGDDQVVSVPMRPNLASMAAGATATGDGEFTERLIDDTEETNWRSLTPTDEPNETEEGRQVEGRQVTVDLAGEAPQAVSEVQVSAILSSCDPDPLLGNCMESDPDQDDTQSRFSALRSFDLFACDATTADCGSDEGYEQIFASPDDAFPADRPRPTSPDLLLRPFDVEDTEATHVRLVVRDNQCTGAPAYQGDVNPIQGDPVFNNPDCDSTAMSPDRAVLSPPVSQVRAAELQVFSQPAPTIPEGPGDDDDDDDDGGSGGGGGGAVPPPSGEPTPPANPPAPPANGGSGLIGDAQDNPGDDVVRVSGTGRVETAAELSEQAFPDGAPAAVLARADEFADALTAATLAAEIGGPVLLTSSSGLDAVTATELERLGAEKVYLAGGTAALSDQVAADVDGLGLDVERLGGAARYHTAALIAAEVVELGGPIEQAIVARADDFPDALAAGNLATTGRAPILLTDTNAMPDVTMQALTDLMADGTVFVAGGTAAVGTAPEADLTAAGYAVERRAGADRYATAIALVDEAVAQGAGREPTLIASGTNFPDALAAVPASFHLGGTLMLVDPQGLANSPAVGQYLESHAEEIETVAIVGGTAAVNQATADQISAAIEG